jgi:hypothetical protein
MKHYIQLKQLSTGYVEGTIPPQFSKDNIKPINKLGSDSIFFLDNRLNLQSMVYIANKICKDTKNNVGFEIVQYNNSIREIGKVLYSKYFNDENA